MKIVVISDTHLPEGISSFPAQLIADIKSADMVIHAGDFVEEQVFEGIKAIARQVKAVHGNMDCDELKDKLPDKEVIIIGKFKIGVIHGNGAPSSLVDFAGEAFKKDSPDLIIFGHAHSAFNEKVGKAIFFNPGSPVDKIYAPYNSYGIIEISDKIEARIVKV
jgi:putative phosphoesterase